jgi:hypothetical protein
MTPAIIRTAAHPHNLCPAAAVAWEDRRTGHVVYWVKAGFVACIGDGVHCLAETFASQADAVAALEAHTVRRAA